MLKISLWNSNGFNNKKKKIIDKEIYNKKSNFIILTESHTIDVIPKQGWIKHQIKAKYKGVCILHSSDIKFRNILTDNDGRFIKGSFKIKNRWLSIAAIYAPAVSSEKEDWWLSNIDSLCKADILAGDFNVTLNSCESASGKININNNTANRIKKALKNLIDIGEKDNKFTFQNKSRIDRIYVNPEKIEVIKTSTILNTINFDHHLIRTKLLTEKVVSPMWKFKKYLIESQDDVVQLKEAISTSIDKSWEKTKENISKNLQRWERTKIKANKRNHNIAKFLSSKYPNSKNYIKWRNRIEYFQYLQRKCQRIKAQINKMKARELPSFIVSSLVKSKSKETNISTTYDNNGTESKNNLENILNFYSNLFKKKEIDKETLKDMLKYFTIPDTVNTNIMGNKISLDELKIAIKSSRNNKSPGDDGIPIIVYKNLNDKMLIQLQDEMNKSLNGKKFIDSWYNGIITLIFKKGDKKDISNYRPITLLNCDYKLFCKVLSNRFNIFIKEIIPNYQIGFMPRRLLYDNILCLDITLRKKLKIINLDFAKAYDSVSQEALIKIFKHLKFPKNFINILKCMFLKSNARVIVNGVLTESFDIQRGVKQGDPLSPILFSFAIELLGRAANDPKLNSEMATINELKMTHLMYADDSILISKSDTGAKIWLEKLKHLDKATGLNINVDKTFTINTEIDTLKKLENDNFRYLGFNFNKNGLIDDFNELNVEVANNIMKRAPMFMNIFLRTSILKSYHLAKLWFKGFILGKNHDIMDKAIKIFLWKTKKNIRVKVSKVRCSRPINLGGLGIWDMPLRYKALKLNLASRIIHNDEMKTNKITKNDWNDIKKLKKLSPFIANIFDELKKSNLDLYLKNKYVEVKEIQNLLYDCKGLNTLMITPKQRQQIEKKNVNIQIIYKNIKNIANLNLRNFVWNCIQGALPFDHKEKCDLCNVPETHNHILFKCKKNIRIQKQAQNFLDLVRKNKKIKYHIHWNEESMWNSLSSTKYKKYREIQLIAAYAAWLQRTKNEDSFLNILKNHLREEHELYKSRNKETEFLERWNFDEIMYNFKGFNTLNRNTKRLIRQ